jgi:hypothetical protein
VQEINKQLEVLRDVPQDEFGMAWGRQEDGLREYINLKIVKNESLLKDGQIKRLQDETIEIQKKLITQNKKLEQFLDEEKAHTQGRYPALVLLRDDRIRNARTRTEMEQKLHQLQEAQRLEQERLKRATALEDELKEEIRRKDEELAKLRKLAAERQKKNCVLL